MVLLHGDAAMKPFCICVCESHRDDSRTKCSRESHSQEEAEEVRGRPGGSEVETRERRKSVKNHSGM